MVVIENANAPEDYAYPLALAAGQTAHVTSSGYALVLDSTGKPVSSIAAPWAIGKNGSVPTNFALNGSTLAQHIAHKASGAGYPIVADPYVTWQPILWWPGNQKVGDRIIVNFDRFETANMAGGGVGVAGALLQRVGLPGWLSAIAVMVARQAAYQSGRCATLQYELYWGWLPNTTTWVRNC